MIASMDTAITPDEIRSRATKALSTMDNLLSKAGIAASTFYRWETGETGTPHPVTIQKIINALAVIEAEAENAS